MSHRALILTSLQGELQQLVQTAIDGLLAEAGRAGEGEAAEAGAAAPSAPEAGGSSIGGGDSEAVAPAAQARRAAVSLLRLQGQLLVEAKRMDEVRICQQNSQCQSLLPSLVALSHCAAALVLWQGMARAIADEGKRAAQRDAMYIHTCLAH